LTGGMSWLTPRAIRKLPDHMIVASTARPMPSILCFVSVTSINTYWTVDCRLKTARLNSRVCKILFEIAPDPFDRRIKITIFYSGELFPDKMHELFHAHAFTCFGHPDM